MITVVKSIIAVPLLLLSFVSLPTSAEILNSGSLNLEEPLAGEDEKPLAEGDEKPSAGEGEKPLAGGAAEPSASLGGKPSASLGEEASASAEETPPPWQKSAQVGAVSTNGNTKTKTFNGSLNLVNHRVRWVHTMDIESLVAEENKTSTAEKYRLNLKSDRKLTGTDFLFLNLTHEDDRFSGFDYQASFSLGYGKSIIETTTTGLQLEAGPGFRQSLEEVSNKTVDEAILRLAGKFYWQISPNGRLDQDIAIESGEDGNITTTKTELTSSINHSLAMKMSYLLTNRSEVPPDSAKTDTETAMTLVFSF